MERDITGKAVEQSAKIAARGIAIVQQNGPLGPGQVKMSRAEMQREVQKMRGEPLLRMAELLGTDEVLDALRNRDA